MVNKDAEQRTLGAASLMVREQVMYVLDPHHRTLRAARYLDKHTRSRVALLLNQLVNTLANEIEKLPRDPEEPITQRLSVLANTRPCTKCGKVTRVAIQDIQESVLVGIECETCAPEFLDGSRRSTTR